MMQVLIIILLGSGAAFASTILEQTSKDSYSITTVTPESAPHTTVDPAEPQVHEDEVITVHWKTILQDVASFRVTVEDQEIADVLAIDGNSTTVSAPSRYITGGSFNLTGNFIGYTITHLTLLDHNGEVLESKNITTSVIVSYQLLNQIYMGTLAVILFVVFVNMGAVFDVSIFKAISKNPVGPLVGMFSQFIVMPLLAFGLSKVFFANEPLHQLGMFLCGTSPGGGTSNMYTYIIGGNFDLSIIMTSISSLAAFGGIPAWTASLGPFISDDQIVVPVVEITMLVLGLLIPVGLGYLIQRYLPKLVFILERMLTPLIILMFLLTLTFGVYANRYVFKLLTLKAVAAGMCLPVLGYSVGFFLAYIFKCPKKDIIAISIETGLQNMGLTVFMLNYTLPAPASTLAITVPACVTFITPVPIFLVFLAIQARAGNLTREKVLLFFKNIARCQWELMPSSNTDGKCRPKDQSDLEGVVATTETDGEANKVKKNSAPATDQSSSVITQGDCDKRQTLDGALHKRNEVDQEEMRGNGAAGTKDSAPGCTTEEISSAVAIDKNSRALVEINAKEDSRRERNVSKGSHNEAFEGNKI